MIVGEVKLDVCSKSEHKTAKAVVYCAMCEEYFCAECAAVHRDFLPRHAKYEQKRGEGEKVKPIFTGKCAAPNHYKSPLVYFCHKHSVLCCAECRNPGEAHCSCKVEPLKSLDIEALKKAFHGDLEALEAEIKSISAKEDTINTNIAEIYNKREEFEKTINDIRATISTTFNKLRDVLSTREAEVMRQLEKISEDQSNTSDTFSLSTEVLCAEAELILEIGRHASENWDDERLGEMMQALSDVRNEVAKIRNITSNAEAPIASPPKVTYKDNSENIIKELNKLGQILVKNPKGPKYTSEWRVGPLCAPSFQDPTIVIASGPNRACDITKDPLPQNSVVKWRIKFIRNGDGWWLWTGVAPGSIDLASTENDSKCGWYLNTYNSTLYSGPPHKYASKEYARGEARDFEMGSVIDVTMNTIDGALSFSQGDKSFGPAYVGIPLDEVLYPAVIFNCKDHSVQFLPEED